MSSRLSGNPNPTGPELSENHLREPELNLVPSDTTENHAQSLNFTNNLNNGVYAVAEKKDGAIVDQFDVDMLGMDLAINRPHPRGNHRLPRCWVIGRKRPWLMPANVSRVIRKIIVKNIHKDGVNWKGVPAPHREKYFQAFKNHFRWDPTDEPAVRTAFMKQAAVRYRDMICRFKKASGDKKPACVSKEVWGNWLAFWSRPEVIEKSEKARRNRYTEKAGPGTGCSRHCGGSRSAHGHAAALEKEIGHPPDAYECSQRLHKRKDGTFIDNRARIIAADVEELARVAREESDDGNVNMTQIYVQAVGVEKQGLFGTGLYAEAFIGVGPPSAHPPLINEGTLRRQVRQELQQQFTEQLAERDARMQQQLDAHRLEMEQQMLAMRAQMDEMCRRSLFPPPGQDA